ncbi:MAG TPA: hypothetical protein VJR29_02495 [bacterium]|nr:hypothetical protein [bacterium]
MRAFLRELSSNISGSSIRNELNALGLEGDPELLGAGLRNFAGRQEQHGRAHIAMAIYQQLAGSPDRYGARESRLAAERLQALHGRGSFGARAEIFAQNFFRDVSDPALLAGMAFAGGVFQGVRVASYGRLLAGTGANFVNRGLGARGLSWGLAVLAEGAAFPLATRSVGALMGREQVWTREALGHELAASYLTLGALRLSGSAGESLARRLNPAGGLLSRGFQQASMFTGITAATWLEQRTGLRERTDGATLLASSLAGLIHFNVAGRLLHGLGGGEFTRRLRFQQERLENLPPPLVAIRPLYLPSRALVPAGAETVFMSGMDGVPSTPPPPPASGEVRTRRTSQPPAPRNPVEDFTQIEKSLAPLYDGRQSGMPWVVEARDLIELYGKAVDSIPVAHPASDHPNILKYLHDITTESNTIHSLLTVARAVESNPALDAMEHSTGQFIEYFYRSANTFINYLKDAGVTIPEPLSQLRTARYWLQYGVERTAGDPPVAQHGENFPYHRGEEGYVITRPNQHVIIMGDERAPRTFELISEGHRVTHVDFDSSKMRITQNLVNMKVQRAKDSGQWRLSLPEGAEFHSSVQNAEFADYVEAYFPKVFEQLTARFDPKRSEQLRELINSNLALRLNPEGSAFVITNRHDAIEDLAEVVRQTPGLELLEQQIIRDRMPLRAGMHVTAVPGENLYSWLVFRKTGS